VCFCQKYFVISLFTVGPIGWTPWLEWTACTSTCGSGTQFRTRSCQNPTVSHFNNSCPGDSRETRACAEFSCKFVNSLFKENIIPHECIHHTCINLLRFKLHFMTSFLQIQWYRKLTLSRFYWLDCLFGVVSLHLHVRCGVTKEDAVLPKPYGVCGQQSRGSIRFSLLYRCCM